MEIAPLAYRHQKIDLYRTDDRHYDILGKNGALKGGQGPQFQDMLMEAMHGVNADQIQLSDMQQEAVINPDSLNEHDIPIQAAKANMSLNLAKGIIERAVRAYKEIINIR